MNKIRRKNLQRVIDRLEELKSAIEDLHDEEEEYLDRIPDNLQGSARYEKAENACSELEDAVSSLEDTISSIEAAIE